ncbi:MAG: tetratricopeptide repeat protein [Nanoarchaeota archaeon]|nr:tetratricopeptide repeat protein [Nanoarchaeota archaeon]
MDVGFYIFNNTIYSRRIDFSRGWNATYAGCSKVVTEFFYSLVYLLHGGNSYKYWSRIYFSLYNYLTAIAVGYTMYIIGQESIFLYCTGLLVFCFISSEPHYGIYFESGEQFEILFQVVGFLLILLGINRGNGYLLAGGVGLWALESYFIKLSSLVGTTILALGVGILYLRSIPYLAVSLIIPFGIYILWVRKNRKSLRELAYFLVGHQKHYGHNVNLKSYLNQISEKSKWLYSILRSHPLIPVVALVGVISGNSKLFLIILYLFNVWSSYVFLAYRMWYHTITFQPVIACLAALGVGIIINNIPYGYLLVVGLLSIWLLMHLRKVYGLTCEELNRWTWQPHGSSMCDKNLMLEKIVPEMRSLVQGQLLFVFGAWNQAYVLLETSYDTNIGIVSAYEYLDDMRPNWLMDLSKQFVKEPPSFMLDSGNCFNSAAARDKLGLDYRLLKVWGDQDFKLFRLESVDRKVNTDLRCQSYRDINEIIAVGNRFLQKGEYEKAAEKYKEASFIEEIPSQIRFFAILGLANCYSSQGKFKEAEEKFNEALSINEVPEPEKAFAHYNLGSVYERKGDYKKAKDKFESVLTLTKDIESLDGKLLGNAHFHLGCIYQSLGEREKAEREFEDCLKLILDHKKAKENLKKIRAINRDF